MPPVQKLSSEETQKIKETYSPIFCTEILGQEYLWRLLTKAEYARINSLDHGDEHKEDLVCETCVLFPKGLVFESTMAGVVATLTAAILKESGFEEATAISLLGQYRKELDTLEAQMETIIKEAFPYLSIEEIESWTVPKTLKYYTRAEWVLEVLRGIPIRKILEELGKQSQTGLVSGDISDFPELAQSQGKPQRRRR